MNNSDERDYAEERANQRLMEDGDRLPGSVFERVTDADRDLARGLLAGEIERDGVTSSSAGSSMYWLGRLSAHLDRYVEEYASHPEIMESRDEESRMMYAVFEHLVTRESP